MSPWDTKRVPDVTLVGSRLQISTDAPSPPYSYPLHTAHTQTQLLFFCFFGKVLLCCVGTRYTDQISFRLAAILLPLALKCWGYRHVPP